MVAIVHGEPRSACSYLVMETHFTKLLIFCSCSGIASRGSTNSLIMYFSIHWPCSGRSRMAEISHAMFKVAELVTNCCKFYKYLCRYFISLCWILYICSNFFFLQKQLTLIISRFFSLTLAIHCVSNSK